MDSNVLKQYQSMADSLAEVAPWLTAQRQQAMNAFMERGFPSHKTEAWKYLRLNVLREHSFMPACRDSIGLDKITPWLLPDCDYVVFVNGFWQESLSQLPATGVHFSALSHVLTEQPELLRDYFDSVDLQQSLLALNSALCQEGMVLRIEAGCQLTQPIQLLFLYDEQESTSQQRHIVQVGEGARLQLIEQHIALTEHTSFTNALWHIDLAPRAQLSWQQWLSHRSQSIYIAHYALTQQAHSEFDGLSFIEGGALVRSFFEQRFAGEYGRCRVKGLTITSGEQQIDQHLCLRHAVAHCQSEQFFKGMAADRSRLVFNGKVIVDHDAQKTDAKQHHQNLLLSRQAEIYTKPELEIYANDVKCAHGATVGQLSDEALFYLKARGLTAEQARRVLMVAFGQELIDAIDFLPLKERMTAAMALQ